MALIGNPVRVVAALLLLAASLCGQLRVMTTVPDFADIVAKIGGDAVEVESLTRGHEDLHLVRIRPSLVVRLRRADAFVQIGLDAEHSWVPPLLRVARNDRIRPGKPGFCDASRGIKPLEILETVSREQGADLHPHGNPHYNLDPIRMRVAAKNIRDFLVRLVPDKKAKFDAGFASWSRELDKRFARWRATLEPLRGAAFIESHSAWIYFAETFGLEIVAKLEPKPGLAPTANHLSQVMRAAQDRNVGLVVGRSRYADVAARVAKETNAKAITMPIYCRAKGELSDWFGFMDHVVHTFAENLRAPRGVANRAEASIQRR